MNRTATLIALGLSLLLALPDRAHAEEVAQVAAETAGDLSGVHDFDYLFGDWRVRHRILRPLKLGQWSEFTGTCSERPLMGGRANVEEHRFEKPTGVTYGIALRAYDPASAQWAIWWVDMRTPHGPLDPPMKGRFENGVGTFYSDFVDNGKPMRVRFLWSQPTPTTARWEQAFSADAGKTWETNWIMEFRRPT